MNFIVMIQGNVHFPITLDPTTWIFDDRKIDLDTYFDTVSSAEEQPSTEADHTARRFARDREEGSNAPDPDPGRGRTNKVRNKKEAIIHGSFGIRFEPFLENAEPKEDASHVVVETEAETHLVSLEEAKNFIVAFSHKGSPLKEDGPVHIYYGDGSNKANPIRQVTGFRVK